MGRNFVTQKVDKSWVKELRDIALERIKKGKDTSMKSIRRLSLAQIRAPEWTDLKKKMIEWDIPDEKRGNLLATFGIFLGLILAVSLGFVILIGSAVFTNFFGTVTTNLVNLPSANNATNISSYASTTFGNVNASFQQLHWMVLLLILGLFLGVVISASMIRSRPMFFMIYFLLMVAATVFAIIISRTYESLYNSSGILGTALQNYASSSWIYLYLPVWVVIFGFIAGIIMYAAFPRDEGAGV